MWAAVRTSPNAFCNPISSKYNHPYLNKGALKKLVIITQNGWTKGGARFIYAHCRKFR